jgi:hypothetical protein
MGLRAALDRVDEPSADGVQAARVDLRLAPLGEAASAVRVAAREGAVIAIAPVIDGEDAPGQPQQSQRDKVSHGCDHA